MEQEHFGVAAADRYDLPDLAPHAYVYHLFHSRDRAAGETVKTPRHFVLYRFAGGGKVRPPAA